MAEAKKKEVKEVKEYWKITAPGWVKPVLRPKIATSERVLKSIKAKKGYKVEEA
tara:strand:+ start:456 stop:617 length:162 start_codon:yes stop_codon:yes gene_type:complete